jgi:hypothetical protein
MALDPGRRRLAEGLADFTALESRRPAQGQLKRAFPLSELPQASGIHHDARSGGNACIARVTFGNVR